jgi:hypothetical protein
MIFNNSHIGSIHPPTSKSSIDFEETGCKSAALILIMKIQPIFLLIFGFIANLCSFAVLIQPRLRRRPTFSYLAFLSLTNALLSVIHALFTILGVYFGLTLENLSLFIFCRLLNRFLIDFLTHFSLYTLTAVDLDRVRTVTSKTNEHRRYSHGNNARYHGCSRAFTRVCIIELSFGLVLFFLDLHWLTSYGYKISDNDSVDPKDITMCTIVDKNGYSSTYGKYLTSVLPITELVLFGIVPFTISLVATIIILRHVSIKYTFANAQNKHLKQSRRRMELHVSILLISLNCVFILFTTPHNIFNVYIGQLHRRLDIKRESDGDFCSVAVTQKSLDLLQQCYFMSTFFLYILTNKRFREEFYRLLKCYAFIFCRNTNTNNQSQQITPRHGQMHMNNNDMNQNYLMAPSPSDLKHSISVSEISQDDCDDDDDDETIPTSIHCTNVF